MNPFLKMRTSSAGNIRPSSPQIPADCQLSIRSLAVMHRGLSLQDRQKTPAFSSFSIDRLAAGCSNPNSRKAFKILKFEDDQPPGPIHRRQPSMIIKDVKQSYEFTKASKPHINKKLSISPQSNIQINDSCTSECDEFSSSKCKGYHRNMNFSKNSMFASTIEPRSSLFNSDIRTSSLFASEIDIKGNHRDTFSKDSELTECIEGPVFTRAEGNTTTAGVPTQEIETIESGMFQPSDFAYEQNVFSSGNNGLGILPVKAYCRNCDLEASTLVTLEMPTLPF